LIFRESRAAMSSSSGIKEVHMAFQLSSPAFRHSQKIPRDYSGEGRNISPPLEWQDLPQGTKELALLCEDPDAPQEEPFVHWLAYKITPDQTELPEALPVAKELERPVSLFQGLNSFAKAGYGGPMPPRRHGRHRYFFKLYALDHELPTEPGIDRDRFLDLIDGHVLGEADLIGIYERS
jgi:hypothetical protein